MKTTKAQFAHRGPAGIAHRDLRTEERLISEAEALAAECDRLAEDNATLRSLVSDLWRGVPGREAADMCERVEAALAVKS